MRNSLFFRLPCPPSCEEGILNPLPSPRPFQKGKGCNSYAISLAFFPTTPSLLRKEGSTAFSKPFSPQGTRDVTAPPVALNRYALRLAGHQSPRQGCFSGDEPAGGRLAETVGQDGTALLKAGASEVSSELF